MPFTEGNIFLTRSPSRMVSNLQNAVATQLGEDHSLDPADPIQALIEAMVQTMVEQENVHEELARNAVGPDAGGQFLDKHLRFTGDEREPSTPATGEVNLTLESSLSKTDFDPLFDQDAIVFIDDNDRRYALTSSVTLTSDPTTTTIAEVRAEFLGSIGNIDADRIVDFAHDSTQTLQRFEDNVQDFTNNEKFTSGRDTEPDPVVKRRIKTQRASRNNPTLDGLIRAASRVPGVDRADGDENTQPFDATQEENVYDGEGGETSALIDSAGGSGVPTQIAVRIEKPERRFVQFLTVELDEDNTAIATHRIETHDEAGDEPSGELPIARLEVTDVDYDGVGQTDTQFLRGSYLEESSSTTFWSVIQLTSGSAKFEGRSSTTIFGVGDAKMLVDGAWENLRNEADDATLTSVLHQVISGIPSGAKRILVDGSFEDDDVAQVLFDTGACGEGWDGKDSGTALDRGQREKTVHFETPVDLPAVIDIQVERTDQFTGTADDVRDTIIDYIGGDDTSDPPTTREGLTFGQRLTLSQITSRIVDDDDTFRGLTDVTLLRAGEKADFPTPDVLTASEENNITPEKKEAFVIEDAANDIRVAFIDQ